MVASKGRDHKGWVRNYIGEKKHEKLITMKWDSLNN